MKKILIILSLTLFIISGCSNNQNNGSNEDVEVAQGSTTVQNIIDRGEIILGTDANYPPYEWHRISGSEDQIIGADIEIAQKVADALGVKLTIKDMLFDGLLTSLKAGDIDFVLSGMVITEKRKEVADFSTPYYEQGQHFVIREEDKDNYNSLEDIENKKIGVQLGTYQQEYAEENFTNSEIIAIPDNNNMVMELKNQTLDLVFLPSSPANQYAQMNDDLISLDLGAPGEGGSAIAVKKGNTDLLEAINEVVEELIQDNTVERLFEEYSQISMDENA